jgi:hypothetical protein
MPWTWLKGSPASGGDYEYGGKGRKGAFMFSPNLKDANAVDNNKNRRRAYDGSLRKRG